MSAERSFLCETPSQPYSNLSLQSSTSQTTKQSLSSTHTSTIANDSNGGKLGNRAKRSTQNNGNSKNTIQVSSMSTNTLSSTRILLVLPIVYIILNTPFYLIRLADTIALNMFNSTEFSIQGGLHNKYIRWLNNGAHYLYYGNFACDVVVYAFSRYNFKAAFF